MVLVPQHAGVFRAECLLLFSERRREHNSGREELLRDERMVNPAAGIPQSGATSLRSRHWELFPTGCTFAAEGLCETRHPIRNYRGDLVLLVRVHVVRSFDDTRVDLTSGLGGAMYRVQFCLPA